MSLGSAEVSRGYNEVARTILGSWHPKEIESYKVGCASAIKTVRSLPSASQLGPQESFSKNGDVPSVLYYECLRVLKGQMRVVRG